MCKKSYVVCISWSVAKINHGSQFQFYLPLFFMAENRCSIILTQRKCLLVLSPQIGLATGIRITMKDSQRHVVFSSFNHGDWRQPAQVTSDTILVANDSIERGSWRGVTLADFKIGWLLWRTVDRFICSFEIFSLKSSGRLMICLSRSARVVLVAMENII